MNRAARPRANPPQVYEFSDPPGYDAAMPNRILLAAIVLIFVADPSLGAPPSPAAKPSTEPAAATQPSSHPDDKLFVTHGEVSIDGKPLKYEATAGTMAMKDEAGKPRANFFFVAYRKEATEKFDPATRPITFVFNGGPGAAAVWLHLGAVGPMTVKVDDEGIPTGPPHALISNSSSWLDATDVVFIDPVNTGYSRAVDGVKPEEFFGVERDIQSVAEFIRLYLTRNNRWLSPRFLAGESYGTTRAAGLSSYLLGHGIDLNGIVFISSVLDFATISHGGSNDLPYILFLPSFTATALYHHKLNDELSNNRAKTLAEVQAWALGDYTAALARGDNLKGDDRAAVIKRLARYTSLSEDTIDKANLRIDPGYFEKHLLGDGRQVVGRFDGRLTGADPAPLSDGPAFDPSYSYYLPAYTATMTNYVRHVLHFESDLPYEALASGKVQPWSMGREGRGFLDVASSLSTAMRENPRMKVLFASGYEDLATPFFATDYTISHMELPEAIRKNITRTMYEGGHMMYHVHDSIQKLHADVKAFMNAAAPGKD
jgi:carboxypeptidase C (cathepsin A)